MKTKNILMSVLLAMGFIAAKAAGYPPELALVSQPVMVYNYNSITVYYDVQNIGDYTYRGHICLYLDPDYGYCYADKYVKVSPGRIKRIALEIPAYRPNPSFTYMVKPYYELGDELYSFTTFEYFEPLCFHWHGMRTEPWVVINVPPRPRDYVSPGTYRYYYDGFRPPMPPAAVGYGPGTPPPPMNPMHHTYNYHLNNGGYPGNPNNWNHDTPPAPNSGNSNGGATVKPNHRNNTSGSMSHGNSNAGNNSGNTSGSMSNGNNHKPNNNGASTGSATSGSNSRRNNNSSNVSRPNNSGASTGSATSGSNSGGGSRGRR